jgi:hypothetical protein
MDTQHTPRPLSQSAHAEFARPPEAASWPLPRYEAPYIVSYTDSDILAELGPALTGSGSGFEPG